MLTIKQFNKIYNKIYHKITDSSFFYKLIGPDPYRLRVQYNRRDRLTEQQWQNLFDVCCIIESNFDRFVMRTFHSQSSCGTTHCIAGWAVAMELNNRDFNYERIGNYDAVLNKYGLNLYSSETPDIAQAMLSRFIEPFFYLTRGSMRQAEILILDEFILPVIEEGKKDGLTVSPTAQSFIQLNNSNSEVSQ